VTVDLSSDETETSAPTGDRSQTRHHSFISDRRPRTEFKKPSAFVELSDDDDSDVAAFLRDSNALTSTLIKNKTTSPRRSESSSFTLPDVTPVNSLKERQQSRKCLQDDAISSIVDRFQASYRKNDSQINEQLKS
jgi:hypothetical protein